MPTFEKTPNDYDRILNEDIATIEFKLSSEISEINEDLTKKIKKYTDQKDNLLDQIKAAESSTFSDRSASMLQISLVASVIVFLYIFIFTNFSLCSSNDQLSQAADSIGMTIENGSDQFFGIILPFQFGVPGIAFLFVLLVGSLLSYPMTKKKNSIRQKEIDKLDASAEEIKLQASKKIEELEEKAKSEIAKIEQEKMKYRSDFENERRVESVKYANSPVAKEVIDLISTGFKNQIDACDRRPHIKEIIVPLSFKVYATKIETPYGVYDFELQRVSKLSGMKEQTSLANAIAQSVHTDIFTTYPVDISGGEVKPLEIGINYGPDWVEAVMTYHADNANYIPERSF